MRGSMIGRLVAPLLALMACVGVSRPAQAQGLPPVFQSWLNNLTSAGYGVTQGSATVTSVSYCKTVIVPVFGTCFSSDPGDPYVVPLMPAGNGYIDPYFGGLENQVLPNGTVVGQAFRLDTTEAELVIVQLPPLAGYFSYQGYVFSRPISDYKHGVGVVSPDPARGDLYASYNNSVDNTDILTRSGLSFGGGFVAFITTPNSSIAADMTSRFASVGGNSNLLFVDPMGSNLNFGLGASSDDFSMLLRYLVPADPRAGSDWLNNAASNVLVYRIDQPASLSVVPYGSTPLRKRSYNTDETPYASNVAELTGLMKGWLAAQNPQHRYQSKQGVSTMKSDASGAYVSGSVGPVCIIHGALCNGDEQDAIHWAVSIGAVMANGLFVVDGVNAAATNDTTVFSFAVEDAKIKTGVLTISQTNAQAAGFSVGAITGSAETALKTLGLWAQASASLQNAAPNLFVQLFTRGCTAQQICCNQSFTAVIPSSALPYQDKIAIFQRAYAVPGYDSGPNTHYVSAPYAIY
jgi:hypothetical protein